MLALAVGARAGTFVFATAPGSLNPLDPQPVFARAVFNTHPGLISVTLENLMADPRSVSQSLNGVAFMVWPGPAQGAVLSGSAAEAITVGHGGSYRSLGVVPTGWRLELSSSLFELCALCAPAGPEHTLLGGPGPGGIYAAANGSIAGSGPHNPFLTGPAMFTIEAPGVSGGAGVEQAVFSFGTAPGADVSGVAQTAVPEPSVLTLLAAGLAALWLLSSGYARQMGAVFRLRRPGGRRARGHFAAQSETRPARAGDGTGEGRAGQAPLG